MLGLLVGVIVIGLVVIGLVVFACIRINHPDYNNIREYNLIGEEITIAECIDRYIEDDSRTIVNDGKVIGWDR